MCFVKGEKNILGTELIPCSTDPMTGFYSLMVRSSISSVWSTSTNSSFDDFY